MSGEVCPICGQVIVSGDKIIYIEGKPQHYRCFTKTPVKPEVKRVPLNMWLVWKAFSESAKECASTLGVTVYDKVYMPKIAECVADRMREMTAEKIKRLHPEWVEEYERIGVSGAPDLYTDRIKERSLHICYICGGEFSLNNAEFCDTCQTYKCSVCGGCFCDLSPEAKKALDAEMVSLGLWSMNPCRRKRRVS